MKPIKIIEEVYRATAQPGAQLNSLAADEAFNVMQESMVAWKMAR